MASPTRAKKRLGHFLLELRTQAGHALSAPADELKASESTVSRYESGHVLPVWSTVLALLGFYGASDAARELAVKLWEQARDEPKPVRLPSSTPKSFRQMLNAEREANGIRAIELSVVHGLLQTEAYTQALFAAASRFHDQEIPVDGDIAVRKARQEVLYDSNPLNLHMVFDEAVIRRKVGSREVQRDQLEHLLRVAALPHVTVQVMPFSAGAYGTMSGAVTIVDFPDKGETPGVYLEYPAGGAWVENEADVQRFTTAFEDAVLAALSPDDSAHLIKQQMRALADDDEQELAEE
ncbi:helix-turn-helix domain-containing protein [Amycolatopsis sp. NPDC058986]|uniref:helix-turn-helix domain-containing protein n=1 Tax=unclassified Amycolatopsis TaxID=2618356 RepID=UPI00366DCA42